jgi:hypothetical protein
MKIGATNSTKAPENATAIVVDTVVAAVKKVVPVTRDAPSVARPTAVGITIPKVVLSTSSKSSPVSFPL